jgi:hypothetical protein
MANQKSPLPLSKLCALNRDFHFDSPFLATIHRTASTRKIIAVSSSRFGRWLIANLLQAYKAWFRPYPSFL